MTTKTPTANGKFRGRPSKYDPAYCEGVVRLGKLGYTRSMIANELGIGWRNLQNWEGAHEEFRVALEQARYDSMAHMERLALEHMIESPGGPKLNTGLWSRSMAARFPNDYRDNSKVEVSGRNGGAIEVDVVHDFAQTLMDELLAARQADAKSDNSD